MPDSMQDGREMIMNVAERAALYGCSTETVYVVARATGGRTKGPGGPPEYPGLPTRWTDSGHSTHGTLAEAVAMCNAIEPAIGLSLSLCRYPPPDDETAPCIAARYHTEPWSVYGTDPELASLTPQRSG